jgi:hypothetical protein
MDEALLDELTKRLSGLLLSQMMDTAERCARICDEMAWPPVPSVEGIAIRAAIKDGCRCLNPDKKHDARCPWRPL